MAVSLEDLTLSFYILAGVYALLIAFPFIQLVRISRIGLPFSKPTTQKTFLLLLFLTAAFRTSFFLAVPLTNPYDTFNITEFSNLILSILDDFGCIVFFTTFTLLILFWAEITLLARNRRSVYSKRVKPLYFTLIALVYVAQLAIWGAMIVADRSGESESTLNKIDNIFYSVISIIAAFGFFYFGGHLYLMLKNNPIESTGRKTKLREVLYITVICTVCFIGRSGLYIVLTFEPHLDVNPLSVVLYYFVSEIFPAFIVLFVLRKLPPRKHTHTYPDKSSTTHSSSQPNNNKHLSNSNQQLKIIKMSNASNNPGNFANRDKDEVREIAAKGGRASHGGGTGASSDDSGNSGNSGSGGTQNTNPGNFANRPKEEVREIAAKGGRASGGGTSDE